ncbi:phage head-tail connector protein [Salipiger pacificus]|nr:phage head-tail connector protein [Alloyangia pacifica]
MDATKIRDALKVLLAIDDDARDAELDRYVSAAISAVEAYTNRQFQSVAQTDRFYTPRRNGVVLPRGPVASIEAIRVDGAALPVGGWHLERGGLVLRMSSDQTPTEWNGALVEVDYTSGIDATPGWLVEATAAIAAEFEDKAGGGAIGSVKRESVPGVFTVEYATGGSTSAFGIPSEVAVLLEMIREPGFA